MKKSASATKTQKRGRKTAGSLTDTKASRFSADHVPDKSRADILDHAREGMRLNPPQEVCGFIATNGKRQKIVRSPNRSSEPRRSFRTCPKAWRRIEDSGWEVAAIYHSHVNEPPTPSVGDKVEAETCRLPFVIVGMPTEVWDTYIPKGWEIGLEGRPFVFGTLDCYTLHRDYHKRVLGIDLPRFEYEDDWWKPKDGKPAQDLYEKYYPKAGFVEVSDLQKHDTILIQIPPSPVRNHCAIYLGDGQILHHLSGRLSVREPYIHGQGYGRAVKIVRHKSLMEKIGNETLL